MYSEKVMKHFRNPSNMGELDEPDVEVQVGNPTCGDMMTVYMDIEKKGDDKYVEDVKFETFGCGAAIATSSVATELVKGETIEEAEELEFEDIADKLGGLPKIKMHCSNLASVAVHEALYQYRKEEGMEISQKLEKQHKSALESKKAVEERREGQGKVFEG
ncbi:MAG: iron-sulfur cluster assembly scaffold protein [Candidatus Nanohaloarchaeota archaeon QJJ-9]|nr:iron-sulfur cluster assembly scaffold protein [Candidatus Nanohaloarchaeota archaeon QJJ-9]